MSVMEIVTGSTGIAHVTPIDDAVRNTNTGHYNDCVVFDTFSKFAAEVKTDTRIEISGGYGMIQGRYFKIAQNDKVSLEIESGRAGIKRLDIICARYTLNNTIESISLVVVKGAEGTDYVAPTDLLHTTGNINEAASVYDFPLYYVYKDGIYIDHIEAKFEALPDGGRLGEIEAEFNEVKTAFHDLETVVEGIPAEVAAAATKSYVDTEVGRISNGLSVVNNKITAMGNHVRNIVQLPIISQLLADLSIDDGGSHVYADVQINSSNETRYIAVSEDSNGDRHTYSMAEEEYNNLKYCEGLIFNIQGNSIEANTNLPTVALTVASPYGEIAFRALVVSVDNQGMTFDFHLFPLKKLESDFRGSTAIGDVSAILPYTS